MEQEFDRAAGTEPSTPEEPVSEVQEQLVEKNEEEQPAPQEGDEPGKTEGEKPVDWQKRYRDTQSSHDRLASENKKVKAQLDELQSSLQKFTEAVAQAESIEDIQSAMIAAEKAQGKLTFEGLDPKAAAIIGNPLNQALAQLRNEISEVRSQLHVQQKTAALEAEYPFLKDHRDSVIEKVKPIIAEYEQTEDGDAMAMRLVSLGFELRDALSSAEVAARKAEAAKLTPAGAATTQVSEPVKEKTLAERQQEELDRVFEEGSMKGRTFSL